MPEMRQDTYKSHMATSHVHKIFFCMSTTTIRDLGLKDNHFQIVTDFLDTFVLMVYNQVRYYKCIKIMTFGEFWCLLSESPTLFGSDCTHPVK
jgi:hypothetical protein